MMPVLRRIYLLVAAAWFGGIVAIAVTLPILFTSDEVTRTQAARLAGQILARFDAMSVVLLPVLAIGAIAVFRATRGTRRATTAILLLGVAALQLAGTLSVRPRMHKLAGEIRTFERSDPMTPARQEFDRLHKWAEGMMTVNLGLLGVLLVLYPTTCTPQARDEEIAPHASCRPQ